MKLTTIASLAAIVVAAAAAQQVPAAATTFYKLTDADGHVTYLDRAPAGFAGRVEVVTVDPDANTARLPDGITAEPPSEAARVLRAAAEERLAARQSARSQLDQAQSELAQAKQALQQAQDQSLPQDWIYFGNAHRAPRPEYLARLESLESQVKQAEDDLAQAERQYRMSY